MNGILWSFEFALNYRLPCSRYIHEQIAYERPNTFTAHIGTLDIEVKKYKNLCDQNKPKAITHNADHIALLSGQPPRYR